MNYEPRYSGKGKSGICKCGHPWSDHHLGMVMNLPYLEATKEGYVPQECEYYGCNETGAMKPVWDRHEKQTVWVAHCGCYDDAGWSLKTVLLRAWYWVKGLRLPSSWDVKMFYYWKLYGWPFFRRCPECAGLGKTWTESGARYDDEPDVCRTCGGKGRVRR